MPTVFAHAAVGLFSAAAIYRKPMPKRFWVLAVVCSIIPDADVLAFKFGIPYGHFFGHRGFFHSLFFAVFLGMAVGCLFFLKSPRRFLYGAYFSLLIALHDLLDAFTNGGLGIALLSPFSTKRYFFWTTPIEVAPLSPKVFFSERAYLILGNELLWVGVPAAVLAFLVWTVRSFYRGEGAE